jgi:protein O-GlcNAc transferase
MSVAEMLALGLQHHQAGNLVQAEQIYHQVLQADPRCADALHLLGQIAHRYGQHKTAIDYISRAIAVSPHAASFHCTLGIVYQAACRHAEATATLRQALELRPDSANIHNTLGVSLKNQARLDEAVACYRRAIELEPDFVFAHNNLGGALAEQNRLDEAIACYHHALRLKPDYADAYKNLGNALARQKRLDEAVASLQQALRLQPDNAAIHNDLGAALVAQDRLDDAISAYRRALSLQPNFAMAHNNLGVALVAQGRLEEAIAAYRQALSLQPDLAIVHNNLGVALLDQGKLSEAAARYRDALRLCPDCFEAHINLCKLLQEQWRLDEAIAHSQAALQIRPQSAAAYSSLGDSLNNQGKIEEARASYEHALSLEPNNRLRILVATLLPLVYESTSHLEEERRRFRDNVRRLHEEGVFLDVTQGGPSPAFYLAYQGKNDRDLQRALGQLYRVPAIEPPSRRRRTAGMNPGARKIKVGFISTYFTTHTIGRLMYSLVAHRSRDRFFVTVLSGTTQPDEITESYHRHADSFISLPANLPAARRLIAEQELDVLFYTDIGMHPLTYTLALFRLAPVQCVTWGHPHTTGLETIDYFISSELCETDEAEEHYTETLVRLKSLPPYSFRPVFEAQSRGRDHFGFANDCHLYACLQSLFKLHPEFDEVLGGILRRDPKAVLALSTGRFSHREKLLRKRFAVSLPDVLNRIRFFGWLSPDDFLNLNAVSDVVLDPMHFGGGRTSYDFLALGLPVVTLPSRFLRGRLTLGMYKKMGLLDCVAGTTEEYVDIAVKLGTEPDYRAAIRSKILAANDVLYEDQEAIRELEDFFERANATV